MTVDYEKQKETIWVRVVAQKSIKICKKNTIFEDIKKEYENDIKGRLLFFRMPFNTVQLIKTFYS